MKRRELNDEGEKGENVGGRERKLGEIVGSLRPLYYPGVGIGIGLVTEELFGNNMGPVLVMGFGYQKNNVPPHFERCGLIGTCFSDAQDCIHPHTEVCGFLH